MKGKINIIISLLIACMMFVLTCCKPNTPDSSTPDSSTPDVGEQSSVNYTDFDFVINGTSKYTIVIPREYSENEYFAAQEINTFLLKACGVKLDIKSDEEVSYNSSSQFIAIGGTKFLEDVNIKPTESELGRYGFILKTVDRSIFIAGATPDGKGALNGTYEFLNLQINWVCYARDEFSYDSFENIKLVDVNLTDKPDISGYIPSSYVTSQKDYTNRLRANHRIGVLGNGKISPYHNMLLWLPAGTYYDEHPEWYNSKQNQLCLTAHGNQEEYEKMIDAAFERMYQEVMTYDLNVVTWTLMDNQDECTCDSCAAAKAKYGASSGQLVKTCNDLSERFAKRFEEEGIDRSISILFFAYFYYFNAPNSDTIKCNDNVYPLVAPFLQMNRAAEMDSDKNAPTKGVIDAWAKISKAMGLWIYSMNCTDYMVPIDTFRALQANYEYFASVNPFYLFDEGVTVQFAENITCFNALLAYLSCNIAWDTSVNVYQLTTAFFDNYFKDASDDMYKFYIEYRMKLQLLYDEKGYTHNWEGSCLRADYFELGTLLSWKTHIDNALASIEKYKYSEPELYNTLNIRIRTEGITVKYLIWKLYGTSYTETEEKLLQKELYDDAMLVGMLSGAMWKPIEDSLQIER